MLEELTHSALGHPGHPGLPGKVILIVGAVLLGAFGILFRRRQKTGAIGGAISAPKAFWLPFAIYLWFVLCFVVGHDAALGNDCSRPFRWVTVSMWTRGLVEMVMLYGTKNWRPRYGITHDVITLALLVAAVVVGRDGLLNSVHTPLMMMGAVMVLVVAASLVLEVVHAWTFSRVVGAGTVGDDGVWFAADDDPRFVAINRRTRVGNFALGIPTMAFVAIWLFS